VDLGLKTYFEGQKMTQDRRIRYSLVAATRRMPKAVIKGCFRSNFSETILIILESNIITIHNQYKSKIKIFLIFINQVNNKAVISNININIIEQSQLSI
jgi:hypothetical protein